MPQQTVMPYQRQVHFADTDAAGVVYFANVLNFCHEAYENALGELGIDLKEFFRAGAIALPIVEAKVKFLRPLYCGDRLFISIRTTTIDRFSFELHYRVELFQDTDAPSTEQRYDPVAIAQTRHVCLKMPERQRTPLPQVLRDWLGDAEELPVEHQHED